MMVLFRKNTMNENDDLKIKEYNFKHSGMTIEDLKNDGNANAFLKDCESNCDNMLSIKKESKELNVNQKNEEIIGKDQCGIDVKRENNKVYCGSLSVNNCVKLQNILFWIFLCLVLDFNIAVGAPMPTGNSSDVPFDTFKCGCTGRGLKRSRVVGGHELSSGSAPWLVALTLSSRPHCGAALVSKQHILTAAHCIDQIDLKELKAWVGIHSLSHAPGSEGHAVSRAWPHPEFDIFSFRNDIAVLFLAEPVSFNMLIRPICLPSDEQAEYASRTAIVSGWGRTAEQDPPSDVPRQAQVQVWSASRCKNAGYPARRVNGPVLCAGLTKGGVDACQGDSGGPLILQGATGAEEIIGVVSWGRGCARPNLPGVYTRVASHLPFLHKILAEACS